MASRQSKEAPAASRLMEVEYALIVPADDNVRDLFTDASVADLVQSISEVGLLTPLNLIEQPDGLFKIQAGHRRHRALGIAIKTHKHSTAIPALVQTDPGDRARVINMLIENMHREDLNPVEEGHAFLRLTAELGLKQAELAKMISRSTTYISDRIALLKLPELVMHQTREGRVPLEIAVALARLGDDKAILKLTMNGQWAPPLQSIQSEAKKIKTHELQDRFIAKLKPHELKIVKQYPPMGQKVLATLTEVKDLDGIEPAFWPEDTTAYVVGDTYSGNVTVTVCRPMSEKEKAKNQAKQQAEYAKADESRKADMEKRQEEIRSSWTDEYRVWHDECESLKNEHAAVRQQHTDALRSAKVGWCRSVSAKLVAGWAMTWVVTVTSGWGYSPLFWQIQEAFQFEVLDGEGDPETVIRVVQQSAADLVAVTAWQLAGKVESAGRALAKFVDEQGIEEPAELRLPPAPGTAAAAELADDEEMSDEERQAIEDQIAQADTEFVGDDGES